MVTPFSVSRSWDRGAIVDAGAVTFGSGTTGVVGVVSPSNALVGSAAYDFVGEAVIPLAGGNYVVLTPNWDNAAIWDAGAVTFGRGATGTLGTVSPANSLVGTTQNELVGNGVLTRLANGHYVVMNGGWDNGPVVNAGAVTMGLSSGVVVGAINDSHSVLGIVPYDAANAVVAHDAWRNQLIVGLGESRRIVLHRPGTATSSLIVGGGPDPSIPGQAVTFAATVTAVPGAPIDGQVTFQASTGELCEDESPTPLATGAASFACSMMFAAPGMRTIIAEYTGSIIHAYSRSGPLEHTTVQPVFANGFEGP